MKTEAVRGDTAAAAQAYCELPRGFTPCEYRIKWADSAWEVLQARRLRCQVFCQEQGLFDGDDHDAIDAVAQPLVAVSCVAGLAEQVVGTVRIHTQEDGVWWGSRLAVAPACRPLGRLGATLIRLAVCSARARGAQVFLAHVQAQNQALFEKLHWRVLRRLTLHGRDHLLMQADLDRYPPCHDPLSGFVARCEVGPSTHAEAARA